MADPDHAAANEGGRLQALLSKVTLAHIGLSAERLPDRSVWYMSIWRTPRLDLSVFLLGRHATLPLHDHPHMTVLRSVAAPPPDRARRETTADAATLVAVRHVCLLSHLLHGAIEYTVYDWATRCATPARRPPSMPPINVVVVPTLSCKSSAPPSPGGRGRVARLHARGTVQAPTKPMVVSPTADNVHEFTALAPAALFDVIAPPYDDACGRSCRYYR